MKALRNMDNRNCGIDFENRNCMVKEIKRDGYDPRVGRIMVETNPHDVPLDGDVIAPIVTPHEPNTQLTIQYTYRKLFMFNGHHLYEAILYFRNDQCRFFDWLLIHYGCTWPFVQTAAICRTWRLWRTEKFWTQILHQYFLVLTFNFPLRAWIWKDIQWRVLVSVWGGLGCEHSEGCRFYNISYFCICINIWPLQTNH